MLLELIALGCRVQIQIFLSMVHRWQMIIAHDWGEILLVVMPGKQRVDHGRSRWTLVVDVPVPMRLFVFLIARLRLWN